MTVAELIARLKEFPADMQVLRVYDDHYPVYVLMEKDDIRTECVFATHDGEFMEYEDTVLVKRVGVETPITMLAIGY